MERCPDCRGELDSIDYVAARLFGHPLRTIIRYCNRCGWFDLHTSEAVPASA